MPTLTPEQQAVIEKLDDAGKALFAKLGSDAESYISQLEGELEIAKAAVDAGNGDGGEKDLTKLIEKASPGLATYIADLQKTTDEALKIAKHEQEQRETAVYLSKAEKFTSLSGTAEEKVAVLKAAYGVSPEAGAQIEQWMQATNAVAAESVKPLLKGYGVSGGASGESGAHAQITAFATELKKNDSKLTNEAAYAEALRSHPELYEKFLSEEG